MAKKKFSVKRVKAKIKRRQKALEKKRRSGKVGGCC